MSLGLTSGTQYSATSPLTSANMIAIVEAAAVATGADQSDIDSSSASLVQKAATDAAITKLDGDFWANKTAKYGTIHWTIDSVDDEHPVSHGYQYWYNRSGGAVAAGDVVVLDTTGTTFREFTTSAIVKDQSVVGVATAAIADGVAGIIAVVGGGAFADVKVAGSSHAAVAKGDLLVNYGTSNLARTVGAMPANSFVSAPKRSIGMPLGAFAIALEASSSDNTIKCKLLNSVGEGCHRYIGTADIESPLIDGVATEVDVSSILDNTDHSPITGIDLAPRLDATVEATLEIRPDGTTTVTTVQFKRWSTPFFIPTTDGAAGSRDALGEFFTYLADSLGGSFTGNDKLAAVGYWY